MTKRRKAVVAVTAGLATISLGLSVTSAAGAAPETTTLGNLKLIRTKTSLLGKHYWYQQTFKGLPVVNGYYAKHETKGGGVEIADGRDAIPANLDVSVKVPAATATSSANSVVSARATRARIAGPHKDAVPAPAATQGAAQLAVVGGKDARVVWKVTSKSAEGVSQSLVDAKSGTVVESKVVSQNIDGHGSVFDPNPVVSEKNEKLTDQNDKNQDALFLAQKNVILRNLDGSGKLNGTYVNIADAKGGVAQSKNNTFVYQRANNKFEQVMAYYHVNQTQEYIHQLGFTEVNNESQDFSINTFAGDNSFYSPDDDMITMGEGGVDDAEDAEVIWHEYGHAMQDDVVPGFGASLEAGSMGEGFGDYWAVTMSEPVSKGFELPCVMDWDSTSYTSTEPHCLRRTDTGKTTDDIVGEVHDDGEIWSNALWDINRALGRTKANKVILEATFFYDPDTSFKAAAQDTVQAARLLYGKAAALQVTDAFKARKIL
ncbi:bacillolysin [Kribbella capetownensis]|uniref:Bacillolysin n=1 Tax=Kribbella capetownensis TaxID=1572659 RepID=A0A4R0JY26_9ACTN|nr:M36 family metallopeptidase [Kribbella capetownensis]TCC51154.1 bacillolysin [Kribbella capetownensis]